VTDERKQFVFRHVAVSIQVGYGGPSFVAKVARLSDCLGRVEPVTEAEIEEVLDMKFREFVPALDPDADEGQ